MTANIRPRWHHQSPVPLGFQALCHITHIITLLKASFWLVCLGAIPNHVQGSLLACSGTTWGCWDWTQIDQVQGKLPLCCAVTPAFRCILLCDSDGISSLPHGAPQCLRISLLLSFLLPLTCGLYMEGTHRHFTHLSWIQSHQKWIYFLIPLKIVIYIEAFETFNMDYF